MSRPRPLATLAALGFAAALGLAACSGGGAESSAATDAPISQAPSAATTACATSTDAATVLATIEGFAFVPATIEAKVGDVVGFTNKDGAAHTVTLDDDACTTGSISADAPAALAFSAPGSYPFHCRIHPQMTGTFEISGTTKVGDGY